MSETLEYIDRYFNGELSPSEKTVFEDRCEADPVFAEDVAFYIQARAGLKDQLHEQKRKEFQEQFNELSSRHQQPAKGIVRKIFPYVAVAAAACLLLFIGLRYFTQTSSQDIAENYIDTHLKELSIQMGTSKDSIDKGVAAYNNKNYKEAEAIFKPLSTHNAEALKYLGFVYLITDDYDKAIVQFETLANNTGLYANAGPFYQAVSLMKRDAEGDKAKAKKILEEVIRRDLPGKKEAEEWIKKL